MSIQISTCYYHPNNQTVAVCSQCGVGICKGCTVIDDFGQAICYKCGNKNLKREHKAYRKELTEQGGRFKSGKDFLIPGIIGILIVIAYGVLCYFVERFRFQYDHNVLEGIIIYFMISYVLFSIPFGVTILNDLFSDRYITLSDRLLLKCLKYLLALFIGWICFTFLWLRFAILKILGKI